jgi:hypothetical protein
LDKRRLLDELVADRAKLLETVGGIRQQDLGLPIRNPGWSVGHVLAHGLASDADLIAFLKAAQTDAESASIPGQPVHDAEMAKWSSATLDAIRHEIRTREVRWMSQITDFPALGWSEVVQKVVNAWRGHDAVHGEDVNRRSMPGRDGRLPAWGFAGHGRASRCMNPIN